MKECFANLIPTGHTKARMENSEQIYAMRLWEERVEREQRVKRVSKLRRTMMAHTPKEQRTKKIKPNLQCYVFSKDED